MERLYPILEYDPSREALINPHQTRTTTHQTKRAVLCFFQDIITRLSQQHQASVATHFQTEMGRHPVYELTLQGQPLLVLHPGVGAPSRQGCLKN